jgi:hypothetical protein
MSQGGSLRVLDLAPEFHADDGFEVNGKQYVTIVSGISPPAKAKLINTPELREQRQVIPASEDTRGQPHYGEREIVEAAGSGVAVHSTTIG